MGHLSKLLSGRYALTIMAGVAFVYCTVTGKLNPETSASIITMVFVSYFQKNKGSE